VTVALYAFISTKTTYDVVLPTIAPNQSEFNRRVAGAFAGLAGGKLTVGELKFFPLSTGVPNHLICDGSTLNILDFPELFDYLGTTFGGDGVTTFMLPDYVNQPIETAATSPTQTIDGGGTVTTGDPVTSDPTLPGGSDGGNIISGGRPPKVDNPFDFR
jgi:hypothetical protein